MKKILCGLFSNVSLLILGCLIIFSAVNRADSQMIVWGADGSYGIAFAQTTVPASATNVMAMAAGDFHVLALSTNGTVVAWGGDEVGNSYNASTNVPSGLTNVVGVA